MVLYKVVTQPTALQHIEDIYQNSEQQKRWNFSETYQYVETIKARLASLAENPNRFSYDEHTRKSKQYRSFQHGSHKVFYAVNEAQKTVDIVAILPGMTKYGKNL